MQMNFVQCRIESQTIWYMFILFMNDSNVFNFLEITATYKTPIYCLKYSENLSFSMGPFLFP